MSTDTPAATAATPAKKPAATEQHAESAFRRLTRRPEMGALAGTIAVFVFFAVLGGQQFLSANGTASWANVAAELAIIAIPVGMLMIAGQLDVSVGSVLAASSMAMAITSGWYELPLPVGILAGLSVGVVAGLVNGIMTTRTQVPSLVVTLGMNFGLVGVTLGLTRLITGTTSVGVTVDGTWNTVFGNLIDGKFEVAIVWAVVVALILTFVLQMSPLGNWIFAIGGDPESARATGIPVNRVKIILFVISGLGASLVGVIQTSLYNGGQTASGQAFVFNSIIAVVIGGVLLTGGYGSVIGIIFGALTFSIVSQGIYYTGWSSDWASFILGGLLLVAVLMNNTFRRLAVSGGRKTVKKKG